MGGHLIKEQAYNLGHPEESFRCYYRTPWNLIAAPQTVLDPLIRYSRSRFLEK